MSTEILHYKLVIRAEITMPNKDNPAETIGFAIQTDLKESEVAFEGAVANTKLHLCKALVKQITDEGYICPPGGVTVVFYEEWEPA